MYMNREEDLFQKFLETAKKKKTIPFHDVFAKSDVNTCNFVMWYAVSDIKACC